MEVIPGGCSSNVNIDRLDCRDRPEFDTTFCPKMKGEGFTIDECNAKCLKITIVYSFKGATGFVGFMMHPTLMAQMEEWRKDGNVV